MLGSTVVAKILSSSTYLYKYSPLHEIKDTTYPVVLIVTGDHDDRVVPCYSYKFAATLQEKNKGTAPILVCTIQNAGHSGDGSYGRQESYTYAFITNLWG